VNVAFAVEGMGAQCDECLAGLAGDVGGIGGMLAGE
jgi:hypothetical protein